MSDDRPIALVNARLVDPAAGSQTLGGVLIENGIIRDLGAAVTRANIGSDARIIDCAGDVVAPGLIDMRVFVGEPGAEHRETIATASAAAAAGGHDDNRRDPRHQPAVRRTGGRRFSHAPRPRHGTRAGAGVGRHHQTA